MLKVGYSLIKGGYGLIMAMLKVGYGHNEERMGINSIRRL